LTARRRAGNVVFQNGVPAVRSMADTVVKFLLAFFVVVEPITLVPVFAALTSDLSDVERHRTATKAVLVSAVICAVFALGGGAFLRAMGISLSAFRIGGGILLFLIALDMVFARGTAVRATTAKEEDETRHRQDISVFPLAFPLITGPGAMATIILAFSEANLGFVEYVAQLLVIALVLLAALACMYLAGPAMRVMGVTGSNVVSRLSGVILAALAVQYVIDGVKGTL